MADIERAFLADIAAQPQDDAPRLIFADWLEEHGEEERAEFIRVQIELDKTGCRCELSCGYLCMWCDEHEEQGQKLCRREKELLPTNAWDWAGEALRNAIRAGTHYMDALVFRRGFISRIALPCAAFLEHAADIIEAVPMLEELRLSDVGPMELHFNDGPSVWVFSRASAWPAAFDAAVNLTHDNRENALSIMSRCCLQFAHEQLAARRNFRPGIVAATAH